MGNAYAAFRPGKIRMRALFGRTISMGFGEGESCLPYFDSV